MANNTLPREELKKELLKLVESDAEFRYALMGLLGFKEILDRITRIEERQQRLEERMLKLEERMLKVEEAINGLQKTLATIAHRFGVLSESAFREAIKGIVEELFGAKAYRWTVYDEEGLVYGRPAQVEVDVVVTDKTHMLVEVKSRADPSDILEITRIAQLYEKKEGVKPNLAIVAGFVSQRARKLAEKLGVKIYTYIELE